MKWSKSWRNYEWTNYVKALLLLPLLFSCLVHPTVIISYLLRCPNKINCLFHMLGTRIRLLLLLFSSLQFNSIHPDFVVDALLMRYESAPKQLHCHNHIQKRGLLSDFCREGNSKVGLTQDSFSLTSQLLLGHSPSIPLWITFQSRPEPACR